jgi:hypothetical protein
MATREEAQQALLDAIEKEAKGGKSGGTNYVYRARALAEAWAWLESPDNSHGATEGEQ